MVAVAIATDTAIYQEDSVIRVVKERFIKSTDPRFFESQKESWSSPPIDGVGYIPSADLLKKSDTELRAIIEQLERERYNVNGWRNHQNKWRKLLGLDETRGKVVLDYGCGCGVEALQFAKTGNRVMVMDIAEGNVELTGRVLGLYGHKPYLSICLSYGGFSFSGRHCRPIDVFYCNGVLHHIPYARDVLRWAAESLAPDGEIRLMLYSDIGWKISTETKEAPPVEEDVETNPLFRKFTSTFDYVGCYADWYSADKLRHRFGDFLELVSFDYICSDNAYCVAILRRKS